LASEHYHTQAPHWHRFCTATSPHVSLPISIFWFHPTTCRRSELALPNWVTKQASSFPHVKSGPTSRRVMNWCLILASTGICLRFSGESCLAFTQSISISNAFSTGLLRSIYADAPCEHCVRKT